MMRLVPAAIALVVAIAAFSGPKFRIEPRWIEPELPEDLVQYLVDQEGAVASLRPEARREIVWNDPVNPGTTPLSVVYLHGFSADRYEVEPLVSNLADALGANVYFARLTGHGRDAAAMAEASAEGWFDDVAEAVAIGNRIGDELILIGTSTGATLALWAAAREEAKGRLAALVLLSPNLGPIDRRSGLALGPWGELLVRILVGREHSFEPQSESQAAHWTYRYPSSALLPMLAVADLVRNQVADPVHAPTLVLYSSSDRIVDVSLLEGLEGRGEPGQVRLRDIGQVDDPQSHVIAGDILSPSSTGAVLAAILEFLAGHVGGARMR